jgi:hypothetical protein
MDGKHVYGGYFIMLFRVYRCSSWSGISWKYVMAWVCLMAVTFFLLKGVQHTWLGSLMCNSGIWGHCWNTLLSNSSFKSVQHWPNVFVETHCCSKITLDDNSVAMMYVIWCAENLWHVGVLQRIHFYSLVWNCSKTCLIWKRGQKGFLNYEVHL